MAQKSNIDCIKELYEAIGRQDLDAIERLAGDASFTEVPFGTTTTVSEDLKAWFDAMPNGKPEIRSLVAEGDRVVVEGIARGRHEGPLDLPDGRIDATGRDVELPFLEIYEMQNGKIRSGRMYWDLLQFKQQLGLQAGAGAGAQEATASE